MTITALTVDFVKREVKAKADFKAKNSKGSYDGVVDLNFAALEATIQGAIVSEFVDVQKVEEKPEAQPAPKTPEDASELDNLDDLLNA